MARVASPTATEGFGFTYADKVGATALVALLARSPFADQELGVVTAVKFGQRPAGWHFDDLLLTLDHLGTEHRLAISIKSASHVGNNGISTEIGDLVWEQATDGGPLDEANDRLALAQPSMNQVIRDELAELYRWALRQQDGQLEAWLQPGVANNLKRALADSVRRGEGKDDAQRFFRLFRVLPLDLDPPQDHTTQASIAKCLTVLHGPTEALAESLWTHLCQLAAEARGSAGSYTLSDLVSKLAPHFQFREHPRVEQDLARIRQFSSDRHISSVRDVIGDDLRLPTGDGVKQLEESLTKAPVVLFLGVSGSGKSVVLRHFVEGAPPSELRLYFRADLNPASPSFLEQHLSLQHSFADCLSEGMFGAITLVIDQVDRLLTEAQIADVVQLLAATKHLRPRVRVIFGCQTAEAERILSRLSQALERNEIHRTIFAPDEEAMFQSVVERFPSLRNIAFRPELRKVFFTPKNVDLLVGRLNDLGDFTEHGITSQKQFVDWFWQQYVLQGEDPISRATCMRKIAEFQADQLSPHISPANVDDRRALDLLVRDRLVSGDDQGVTFQHDSYGDWARLRSIDEAETNLPAFFEERGKNPLWLRALRLWSAILLETKGAEAWKLIFDQFGGDGPVPWLVRDALLDGLALAAGSYEYLTELKPVLFASNGALLKRFFARFLFATSSPNDAIAHAFAGEDPSSLATYRAEFRVPHWYLWGPVIRFVTENADACKSLAPTLTSEVIQPWLESIPAGIPRTKEIAGLAVTLAYEHLEEERRNRDETDNDFRVFRCLCLALAHVPESAEPLIRAAIGRTGNDPYPNSQVRDGKRFVEVESFHMPGRSEVVGPWPDGPVARPSDRFREFILMGGGLRELYGHSPDFAREIILAAAIREPYLREPHHMRIPSPDRELSIAEGRRFYPTFHNKGLFAYIFGLDADWALNLVLTLVDFAVDRLQDEAAEEHGYDASFELIINGQVRRINGDATSFGWHRDSNGSPNLITCALMALEKWLYEVIERGEGQDVLQDLIQRIRSAPIVGVLLSVGKKNNWLLQDTLRFLHFSEVVHWVDIDLVVRNENHQMIDWTGKSQADIEAALEWHNMPHRKQLLKALAFLALNLPEGRSEAKTACKRWANAAKKASPEHKGSYDNLIAIYTFENYSFEQRDDGVLIQCNLPRAIQKAAEEHSAAAERSIAPLHLAMRSRLILNGDATTPEEIADLYSKARALEADPLERDSVISMEDALVGIAAVLQLKGAEFTDGNNEALDWAQRMIVQTCLNPPSRWEFDSDQSVSDNQWCHFAAQALPSICANRPDDLELRTALAAVVEEGHYKTTAFLARAIFEVRSKDTKLYDQTVALLRAWAIETMHQHEVDRKSSYPEYQMTSEDWPDYADIRARFVDGSLDTTRHPLPAPVAVQRETPRGRHGGHDRDRARPLLDTHRLYYFIVNLPWQTLPEDAAERADVLSQWNDLFLELVAEISNGHMGGEEGSSVDWYQDEWQFFRYCGQLAAGGGVDSPMDEWAKRILQILPYAEHHAEQFILGVFDRLLSEDIPSHGVTERWLQLLECVLGSRTPSQADWNKQYGWHEWDHWLVGDDHLLRRFNWRASHRVFVEQHVLIYESWVRQTCGSERGFRSMLAFLEMPACEGIRARACTWIDSELQGNLPNGRGTEVNDALASFLASARTQVTQARHSLPESFASFLNLTAMLNVKNNKLAMQLFEDVATLG